MQAKQSKARRRASPVEHSKGLSTKWATHCALKLMVHHISCSMFHVLHVACRMLLVHKEKLFGLCPSPHMHLCTRQRVFRG